MNTQMFLENFGHIANALGGVEKLRNMIVFLGINGRLTTNNPNEEPVKLLLTGLNDAGYPLNWRLGILEETLVFEYGKNLPAKVRSETGEFPVFGSNGIVGTHDSYLTEKPAIIVGRKGSAGALNLSFVPSWTTDVAYYICPPAELELRFVFYLLTSFDLPNLGKGIKPGLSRKDAYKLPVAIPPLEEQRRIVAKLDELMALCDKLETQQQERERRFPMLSRACHARFVESPSLDNLKGIFDEAGTVSTEDLRKAVLDLAIQGKLISRTAQPDIQPLGSLLENASLNGVSKSPTQDQSATEVLKISAGTSRDDFFVDESDYKYVKLEPDEIANFQLIPGDLLACRYNGNLHFVGRFSLYRGVAGRIQVNPDKLIRFRIDKKFHYPRYICYAMNAPSTRIVIESMCATTAGNIGLSAGKIKKVVIPVPLLSEQRKIAAKVDQLMALIDKLEEQQTRKAKVAQAFAQAAVSAITGTEIKEPEKMKAPKTELVSRLQTRNKPNAADPAPLTKLLTEHNGELPAKALWQRSGLEIDAFYQQLRTEMANGWIIEPEKAVMKEIEAD